MASRSLRTILLRKRFRYATMFSGNMHINPRRRTNSNQSPLQKAIQGRCKPEASIGEKAVWSVFLKADMMFMSSRVEPRDHISSLGS